MADLTAKAWQTTARRLASSLPGEWKVGGSGIRTTAVRVRDYWILDWIGVSRVRRDDLPRLMGGLTPLLAPFGGVAIIRGISGSYRPGFPDQLDLTDATEPDLTTQFARAVIDAIQPWTPQRLADEAENQLAQPPAERGRPLIFPHAAGWRVALDTESPVDPATQAADWFDDAYAPDNAAWYRSLLNAWQADGHPAALAYLEEQRAEALTSLKLK